MKKNKGFTLAEMLIVVAIIGVLIAILVPSFTTQLEKARETTDAANIRSAVSEAISAALTGGTAPDPVKISQQEAGWKYVKDIAGYDTSSASGLKSVGKGGTMTVTSDTAGNVTFTYAASK